MSTDTPRTFRRSLFAGLRPTGIVLGTIGWAASLAPSILPRDWIFQGAISALSFAIGYGIGVALGALARAAATRLQPNWRDRVPALPARSGMIALGITVILGVTWVAITFGWQNQQRSLVGIGAASAVSVIPALLVTVLVSALVIGTVRIFNYPFRSLDLWLARHTSHWISNLVATVVVAVVITILLPDVLGNVFIDWANDKFGAVDNGTPAGISQPTTPTFSGSPDSLTPWKTLGSEGRNFAGGAPTQAQLQSFTGEQRSAKTPVRVYVGLDTAPTPEARAELAVRELERAGGFDRAVLCVATVTGTGWVDPAAARALEYMWAGDTAIVAQQYSFFPSWISFLVDAEKSEAAGKALNDAIYKKWSTLPPATRPKLVVFGLSLGSFGAEAAYAGGDAAASIDALTTRTDGTYLVGPTNTNEIWNQLQATRLAGSPAWRPRVRSENVWFANSADEENKAGEWPKPRVLYTMHASDPVSWWNWRTIWSRPPWVDRPTGPDVPDTVRWTPIVTWLQTVGDLINGFSTDPGHGHNYTDAYVNGWAAVVPPPAWTDVDSTRLNTLILRGGSDANSGNS